MKEKKSTKNIYLVFFKKKVQAIQSIQHFSKIKLIYHSTIRMEKHKPSNIKNNLNV
jgi:hypothetical protein